MKRDWDLIRKQLTDVEEENDLFSDIPPEPKWLDQGEGTYNEQMKKYEAIEGRIFGHFELLINAGYVDGLQIIRSLNGQLHYSSTVPRLTMAGHDLLDTMRSATIWEKIKASAKSKGVELTFEVIKALGAIVIKKIVSE